MSKIDFDKNLTIILDEMKTQIDEQFDHFKECRTATTDDLKFLAEIFRSSIDDFGQLVSSEIAQSTLDHNNKLHK